MQQNHWAGRQVVHGRQAGSSPASIRWHLGWHRHKGNFHPPRRHANQESSLLYGWGGKKGGRGTGLTHMESVGHLGERKEGTWETVQKVNQPQLGIRRHHGTAVAGNAWGRQNGSGHGNEPAN